jgi:glycosyltransferase involved in cell wall biosynthesis
MMPDQSSPDWTAPLHGPIGLRVLMLSADYPPATWSGIGVALESHARALTALGVEVHILTKGPSCEEPGGPYVHSLDSASFPIDANGFNWIHLHSLSLAELAFELRRRTGTPIVYTAHSLVALELGQLTPEARWWSLVQMEVLRASDMVVFLSESERSAGLVLAPEIRSRSRVAGNGLPPAPFGRRRVSDAPVVFAGRFAQSKGIRLLEQMLPLLRKAWPGRFVIAGGHGDVLSQIAVSRLRSFLGESLETPGWLPHDELEMLLATAALVLVPSYYEPFGMIALEAMRVGAPVLAARVGGLQEAVKPGSGGRLVDSHCPRKWCDSAMRILSDRQLSQSLEELGPPYVADQFSSVQAAERLLQQVYSQRVH